MTGKILSALVLIAATTLGVPAGLQAQSDDPEAERVALMRSNGMTLRSAMRATGDEAIAAAHTFSENFAALPVLFEDPDIRGDASPAVWENFDAFVAIFAEAQEASEAALAAAQAGDMDGYAANIQIVASTCNSCHGQYRED